jgi:hypothetical protein
MIYLCVAVMMNPMGMLGGNDQQPPSSSSDEQSQSQASIFSLPLKFLSNGRPSQIDNPKKKPPPKNNAITADPSKTTNLISGGKYSFNGRPNGVFIVRSPIGTPAMIL